MLDWFAHTPKIAIAYISLYRPERPFNKDAQIKCQA
jgi:hypothetical protein